MEKLIFDYLNQVYIISGTRKICYGNKPVYYEEVGDNLNSVFGLNGYEVYGYIISFI